VSHTSVPSPWHHDREVSEPPVPQVPWSATQAEFLAAAREASGAACLVFVIADSVPQTARAGFAQLIIAYARENEPVTVSADGTSALLIRDGGMEAGRVVAERIFTQMRRISLETTLRAGVAPLHGDPDTAVKVAKNLAEAADPGKVSLAA
jgi:hypothetical protein